MRLLMMRLPPLLAIAACLLVHPIGRRRRIIHCRELIDGNALGGGCHEEQKDEETKLVDPLLVCSAYKKNRFYIFSRREPVENPETNIGRDVWNEKPSKEVKLTNLKKKMLYYLRLG